MNVRLLREIEKHISEEPRRFIMGDAFALGEKITDKLFISVDRGYKTVELNPPCGTAACIAGWTCLLTGHKPEAFQKHDIWGDGYNFWGESGICGIARNALGIAYQEADRLFIARHWPARFHRAFLAAKTPKGRAAIAVRRIEHFIKTKGAE